MNPFNRSDLLVYNPTDVDVLLKYDGKEFVLGSGKELSLPNIKIHRWMLKKYRDKGIVNWTYGESEQKKFQTLEKFQRAQIIEGLKKLHNACLVHLALEQSAANESASTTNAPLDRMNFKVKDFEDRAKRVENALVKAMEQSNESRANKNKAKAEA